jgi:hypothetical protein
MVERMDFSATIRETFFAIEDDVIASLGSATTRS